MSRLGFSTNLHCAPAANLSLCAMQNEFSGSCSVPQQQPSDLQSNSSPTSGAELSPLTLSSLGVGGFAHHQLLPGTANNLNGSSNPNCQKQQQQQQQLVAAAMNLSAVGVSPDAATGASSASSANSGGGSCGVAPALSPPAKSFAPLQKDTTFTKIFVGGLPYHTTGARFTRFVLTPFFIAFLHSSLRSRDRPTLSITFHSSPITDPISTAISTVHYLYSTFEIICISSSEHISVQYIFCKRCQYCAVLQ